MRKLNKAENKSFIQLQLFRAVLASTIAFFLTLPVELGTPTTLLIIPVVLAVFYSGWV